MRPILAVTLGSVFVSLAAGCSKKEAEVERGSAPPPIESAKPGACASGGGTVTDALTASFFPRTSGTYCLDPSGEARTYGEAAKGSLDAVCTELLDGECEIYKSYGLKRVVTVRYVDGKGSPGTVNITLSKYGSPEGAYGFFTKRVVADGDPAEGTPRPLEAPGAAALGTGIAYVWRGEHVAELSYANELETPDQIKASSASLLPELAQKVAAQLPGEATPLPAVQLLPSAAHLPLGTSYAHKDLLGVSGVGPGAIGYYKEGETRYRVLAAVRADEDSAKDVISTLKKLPAAKALKDVGFEGVEFTTRDAEGAPQAEWIAGRADRKVFFVGDEPLVLKAGDQGPPKLARADKLARVKALVEAR